MGTLLTLPGTAQWIRLIVFSCLALIIVGCSLPPSFAAPEPSPTQLLTYHRVASNAPPEAPKPHYYPQKPITILVGSSRGGDPDIAARLLAAQMEKIIASPVIVSNRPENDGLEVYTQVKSAASDGYILGLAASPQLQAAALDAGGKAPYSPADFLPLGSQFRDPVIIFVRNLSPFKSVDEFITMVRSQPDKVMVSIPQKSMAEKLAAEELRRNAGLRLRLGIYTDPANALLATLSGQSEAAFCSLSSALPMVKANQGRFLATMSFERLSTQPEVPTLREKGVDIAAQSVFGYVAAKKTAPDIADYLCWVLYQAISDPQHQARMQDAGMSVDYLNRQQFSTLLTSEGERIKKLIQSPLSWR